MIQGNYVGLTPTGMGAMSNGWEAIGIYNGARSTLVENNVLSGNGSVGVRIGGAYQNVVQETSSA